MGILSKVHELAGQGKRPRYEIKQHCKRCDTVLALELTDKLGFRAFSEYWWNKNGVWLKERWYGNWTRCPNCGLEGRLPPDKPLAAEQILNRSDADPELERQIARSLEAKKSNND